MIPGVSPRELKRMLKRMGMDIEELSNVEKVEITLSGKKIVIDKPEVVVIKMKDQRIFQITSSSVREEVVETISLREEDIDFIVSQTGVSREKAREALIKTRGDIAEAILLIKEGRV